MQMLRFHVIIKKNNANIFSFINNINSFLVNICEFNETRDIRRSIDDYVNA